MPTGCPLITGGVGTGNDCCDIFVGFIPKSCWTEPEVSSDDVDDTVVGFGANAPSCPGVNAIVFSSLSISHKNALQWSNVVSCGGMLGGLLTWLGDQLCTM